MPLSNLDHTKIYYYVICVMAFFVLMWGVIDLTSSSIGLISIAGDAAPPSESVEMVPQDKGDQIFDTYYQKKMLQDRLFDSLARVLISGVIFGYCRLKTRKLETPA